MEKAINFDRNFIVVNEEIANSILADTIYGISHHLCRDLSYDYTVLGSATFFFLGVIMVSEPKTFILRISVGPIMVPRRRQLS